MSDYVNINSASLVHATSTFVGPEFDEWKVYLFGNKPHGASFIYRPLRGHVPNWFIRWMMKICLGCTWVKDSVELQDKAKTK